jgi:hypothetical protein
MDSIFWLAKQLGGVLIVLLVIFVAFHLIVWLWGSVAHETYVSESEEREIVARQAAAAKQREFDKRCNGMSWREKEREWRRSLGYEDLPQNAQAARARRAERDALESRIEVCRTCVWISVVMACFFGLFGFLLLSVVIQRESWELRDSAYLLIAGACAISAVGCHLVRRKSERQVERIQAERAAQRRIADGA